jgi:hypothetical protein
MGLKRKVLKSALRSRLLSQMLERALDVKYEIELDKHAPLNTRAMIDELFYILQPTLKVNIVRFGDDMDGGYVLVDCIKDSTFVLSIGVGNNITFDSTISNHVSRVIMVDHTVNIGNVPSNAWFIKKKLVPFVKDNTLETSLPELINQVPLNSRIILKMDIEGNEWEILESLDGAYLKKFDQMVIEFHGILEKAKKDSLDSMQNVIRKLLNFFDVVNIHANNYSSYQIFLNFPLVDVIEVTFLNRQVSDYSRVYNNSKHLNFPNNPNKPEIFLTFPNL